MTKRAGRDIEQSSQRGGDSGGSKEQSNQEGGDSGGLVAPGGGGVVITDPLNVIFTPFEYNLKAKFPLGAWRPDLRALVVLAEFSATEWEEIDIEPDAPFDDPSMFNQIIEEIEFLKGLFNDRKRLAAEIFDQDTRVPDYFAHLLMLKPAAHPNTLVLIQAALKVGQMVGMYFKDKYKRARPQQINPALTPMIAPPGHPSYPSAHSLESHLIAKVLAAVVPGATKLLNALAERMAKNREVAGVHYPSDTAAGEKAAADAFQLLNGCTSFTDLVGEAKKEHQPPW